jgi:hypothetical protein
MVVKVPGSEKWGQGSSPCTAAVAWQIPSLLLALASLTYHLGQAALRD